jgi:hypothetical protein
MSSAKLDTCFRNILDHHYTLGLFAGTLKNEIVSFGFLDRQHFNNTSIFSFNNDWQFCLANLAFKLLEVVMKSSSYHFFLHFYGNPL